MPDLLIYCSEGDSGFELEKLGSEKGFRVKSTHQLRTALEWLNMRRFDVVFTHTAVPIPDQQTLAGLLWERNPMGSFVTYDFDPLPRPEGREVKLFGAELIAGEGARERVEEFLDSYVDSNEAEDSESDQMSPDQFRVLVVEDLDSPRDIICFYIETMGYSHVTGASSAKEALELLGDDPNSFSCIITDIRMPEMDGRELIEHIRNNPWIGHLPVIALTAYGTGDMLTECLRAGASGFMVKPPKKHDLQRELSRAMRIVARKQNPRLASEEDAEQIHDLLVRKGYI